MLVVLAVDVQQFNLGYGIGVTSPMIAQLTGSYLDTEAASSWFASSLVLGQVLGTLLGGGLASKGTYIYYATWFGEILPSSPMPPSLLQIEDIWWKQASISMILVSELLERS